MSEDEALVKRICEEIAALDLPPGEWTAEGYRAAACIRGLAQDAARAAIAAMQSEGIPIYATSKGETEVFERGGETCVTCGRTYDLTDPDQVAYHEQEGEH